MGSIKINYRIKINKLKNESGFTGDGVVTIFKGNEIQEKSMGFEGDEIYKSKEECRKKLKTKTLKQIESESPGSKPIESEN